MAKLMFDSIVDHQQNAIASMQLRGDWQQAVQAALDQIRAANQVIDLATAQASAMGLLRGLHLGDAITSMQVHILTAAYKQAYEHRFFDLALSMPKPNHSAGA
jgi:hypothetical protein